jgi:PAS domain S-box-containing protein
MILDLTLAIALAVAVIALVYRWRTTTTIDAIIEAAPDAIVTVGRNGKIRSANQRVTAIFGYEPSELIGKPIEILVPQHRRPGHPELRQKFMDEGVARRMGERSADLRGVRKDGSEVRVDISLSVIRVGRRKLVIAAVRDLTLTLQAQADEQERLRQILDTSPVGVAITVEGEVRFANPSFTELLGARPGDAMVKIYKNPEDRQAVLDRLERDGIVRDYELSMVDAHGTTRAILLTLIRTTFEGRDAKFGWAVDVTRLKNVEAEMRRVNFLSDSALDLTKAGYWYIDANDPGYFEASDRVRDIFGEAPKPDRRYHLVDEWHSRIVAVDPKAAERVTELFQGAMDGKYDQYDAEYPYRRPADGRVIWTRARAFVERDASGRMRKMFGVQQDLTEQHAAELALQESEQRLDAAVNGANLGLWDVDPATGQILVNEILESQLGYPDQTLRESADKWSPLKGGLQRWPDQLHEEDRAKVADLITRHVSGQDEIYRAEHRVRTADGSYKWILSTGSSAQRDANGRSLRVHGVHIDISETKRLEALRDSLTHMIVHDLRSPLTGVLMSLEMLTENKLVTDAKAQDVLRRSLSSAQQLTHMISTLLDVNKMEAGEMTLHRETGDLRDAATSALATLSGLVMDRQVVIEADAPVIASFDRDIIVRVVSNLVANAVKFTPRNGRITLRLGAMRGGACCEVIDTGRGIPPELHARVFEKFGQVEAREQKQHLGTGLGLTFCQLAVQAHGGSIGVESEVGKGSTFWFVLG